MRCIIVALLSTFLASTAFGQELNEVGHAKEIFTSNWNGENFTAIEQVLPDGSRIDLLSDEYAYEVDWCKGLKWAEAVGQASFYAIATGKKPAIILLKEGKEGDEEYLRCLAVCNKLGIRLLVYQVKN